MAPGKSLRRYRDGPRNARAQRGGYQILIKCEALSLREARKAPLVDGERALGESCAVNPSPRLVAFGPFTFDPEAAVLWRGEERVHLTEAELSLLHALAEQPGVVVTRRELGQRSRVTGSDRAIDTQIARLRRKLEPDPRRPRNLLTKRGEGYVLKPGS